MDNKISADDLAWLHKHHAKMVFETDGSISIHVSGHPTFSGVTIDKAIRKIRTKVDFIDSELEQLGFDL